MIVGFFMMCFTNKYYRFPIWKVAAAFAVVSAASYAGINLMAFIESGRWGGRSFYGAVFMIPILMFPASKLLKVSYGKLLDLVPPAGFLLLAMFKLKCRIDGCCRGRIVEIGGSRLRFPSQIVECVAALILMAIMLVIIKSGRWKGYYYAWCLLLYGAVRFILNAFRETTPWIGPFAAGSFWSLVAFVIGAVVLLCAKKHKEAK